MPAKALLLTAALTTTAWAGIAVEKVTEKFERPLWVGQPAGIDDKLWVVEQFGKIWIVDAKTGEHSAKPFLDMGDVITHKGNEQGLLGLAFSPDFKTTGRFYVNYTDKERHDCLARYTANKDLAETDPKTAEVLLSFDDPYENHNGGWVAFGPDGMLYTSYGDGGAGNDPPNNAQNLNSFLGKIHRLDVSGEKGYKVPKDNPFVGKPNAKPEIWCYGLRNSWRCSFDRETGDLWIGDVGQNVWEEVDHRAKGKASGANFGWRLREGLTPTPEKNVGGEAPPNAIDPVYVYKHGAAPDQGISITGGYVYRGPVKELQGRYIFADYGMPHVWSFKLKDEKVEDFQDLSEQLKPAGSRTTSFGEDNAGNIYLVDQAGPIYRIVEKK